MLQHVGSYFPVHFVVLSQQQPKPGKAMPLGLRQCGGRFIFRLAGRGLEICWLKSHTDLMFTQIQGSARVQLADGSTLRINYDAQNGYPYTPVGRILIERNIVPREQMSMPLAATPLTVKVARTPATPSAAR